MIPEFFQKDPSFLINKLNLDLGVRQNKKRVHYVKLPKWAKDSPEKYL
jgi:factor associated with neutral sphingomyelinase activation